MNEPKQTYVLHGVADRNPGEPLVSVCMFFSNRVDLADFARDLPGKYEVLTMVGVDYDNFTISHD